MATSPTVNVPPGFVLESPQQPTPQQAQNTITPPAGFVLEQPQPKSVPNTPMVTGTISAIHEPDTISGKIANWTDKVANDIKYGTDETGIGTVLKKMGAHGVYNGNPEAVGDFMASLPLGLLRMAKGGGKILFGGADESLEGLKDEALGGLQTGQIPASFIAPEAADTEALSNAGERIAGATGKIVGKAKSILKPTETALENPVETIVSNALSKARIAKGSPASVAPAGDSIQPELQQGIRSVLDKVAGPNEPASIRDVAKQVGDVVYTRSKAAYKQLDEASGGRWQRFDDQLKNVRRKMAEVNGIDEDAYAKLEQKQNELETSQAQLIENMKEQGKVDPKLADQARTDYRKASALYDLDRQVKMSTSGRAGISKAGETVDPNKLVSRLHKLYDTGRLQEAVGKENAAALIEHAENAQAASLAIKNFEPSTATGQQALKAILTKNTAAKPGIRGAKAITDWSAALKDFENLDQPTKAKMFGQEVERVRAYLNRQALKQTATKILLGESPTGKLIRAGALEEALRRTLF